MRGRWPGARARLKQTGRGSRAAQQECAGQTAQVALTEQARPRQFFILRSMPVCFSRAGHKASLPVPVSAGADKEASAISQQAGPAHPGTLSGVSGDFAGERPLRHAGHFVPPACSMEESGEETELSGVLSQCTGEEPLVSTLNQWALILASQSIPYRLSSQGRSGQLHVPLHWRTAAIAEICAAPHEREALNPEQSPTVQGFDARGALLVLLGLFLFHGLVHGWWVTIFPFEVWLQMGGLDAARVWNGHEWYRVVTALTLHADSTHIFGNLVFGGLILVMLCRGIGTGLACFAALAAGAMGNTAMLFIRHEQYLSIGFSTALFGVMGVLCSLAVARSEGHGWRRLVIPVAVGLAWLGLLGSGDWNSGAPCTDEQFFWAPGQRGNADLGAHLMGFIAGLVFGAFTGAWLWRRSTPSAMASAAWGGLATAVVAVSWGLALRGGP